MKKYFRNAIPTDSSIEFARYKELLLKKEVLEKNLLKAIDDCSFFVCNIKGNLADHKKEYEPYLHRIQSCVTAVVDIDMKCYAQHLKVKWTSIKESGGK